MKLIMMPGLHALLKRFRRANGGSVAVTSVFVMLILIGVTGAGIDFSLATSDQRSMQDAADAAALAGAQAANAYLASNGTGSTQITQAIQIGNTAATTFFNADAHVFAAGTATPTMSANTTVSSGAPTVAVNAHMAYSPFLLSAVGVNSVPIQVNSTTTMSPANSYYQIIFVVDVSGSMSIGGTAQTIASMATMKAFNQDPSVSSGQSIACAFACHDPTDAESYQATNYCDANPKDYYCQYNGNDYCPYGTNKCAMVQSKTMIDKRSLAKLYGISLKIDYVNSAIQNFMTQLTTYNVKYPGRYAAGIDTFGTTFNVVQAPTTSLSTVTAAASTIDVEAVKGPVAQTNWGYTYTTAGLAGALSSITNMGDGSSPTKMRTYVIFLTDAVEDIPGSQIYGRGADLNYASECTALKTAGVNMFTIWTPYYNTNDIQYATLVQPLVNNMPTTMQNCASNPSQYFQANDGPGITTAVNNTFDNIINNSKLRVSQ